MKDVPWGPLGEIVYTRTYSRFLEEKKRREYWPETVARAVAYSESLAPVEDGERDRLFDLWYSLKAAPAGRTLWIGGTPISKTNPEANMNCAFENLDDSKAFHDMQFLLMSGAGVGFRVTQDVISRLNKNLPLPEYPPQLTLVDDGFYGYDSSKYTERTLFLMDADGVPRIVVGDSREGWAEGIQRFLEVMSSGVRQIRIDLNSIRPKGERLKRFGGYASGPEPLSDFFKFAMLVLFDKNRPKGWTDTKALDIGNLIARATVAGGTRRSAQIALGDSDAFADAKTGQWASMDESYSWLDQGFIPHGKIPPWRSQSNNTVMFFEHPGKDKIREIMDRVLEFGEPGFLNAKEASKRRNGEFAGVNPCLVGSTLVPVPGEGLKFIADLAGSTVPVRDGNGEVVQAKAEKTGEDQPLLRVTLSDGSYYDVTPWHEFVLESGEKKEARHLKKGESIKPSSVAGLFGKKHLPEKAYLYGWILASHDFCSDWRHRVLIPSDFTEAIDRISKVVPTAFRDTVYVGGKEYVKFCIERQWRTPHQMVPRDVLEGDFATVLSFVQALADAFQGRVITRYPEFAQHVMFLFRLLGIYSWVNAKEESFRGSDVKLAKYEVVYSASELRKVSEAGQPKNDDPIPVVVSNVEELGRRADVYCFGVPTTNSFDLPTAHSGNCSEILLRDHGFCNLVTVNVSAFARPGSIDMDGLSEAIRLSARHAVRITTIEIGDRLKEWDQTQKEDRLIGVSMTGLMDAAAIAGYDDIDIAHMMGTLRDVTHRAAEEYARLLGIPKPKLMTTVKPEGTWSLLPGVSSGIHDSYAPYFIRRVRISKDDAVAQALIRQGFRYEDDMFAPNTYVFEFPVKTPAKRSANQVPALEMLERYRMSMKHWTDHNTSITVAVGDDEVEAVVDWLDQHWDEIVAVSFLKKQTSVYPQQPYEEIDAQRYRELAAQTPRFDRSILDQIEGGLGLFMAVDDIEADCDSGHCPVR